MKLLYGSELADYIKERQAKQVRNLRQAHGIAPSLAIVQTSENEVINTYVRMKRLYGEDVGVAVHVYKPASAELLEVITNLNNDDTVHGVIVQLPLQDNTQTDEALKLVTAQKDVDGLSGKSEFVPATAMAIDWLLNGYNVELKRKKIAIVGNGKLVGAPLFKLWKTAGLDVTVFDENSKNIMKNLKKYQIIVTATGVPGLISSHSIQAGAVVVDAATSAEHGKILGDVADDVRDRTDLTITPEKGGVGPLTVSALFDNVIRAARPKSS